MQVASSAHRRERCRKPRDGQKNGVAVGKGGLGFSFLFSMLWYILVYNHEYIQLIKKKIPHANGRKNFFLEAGSEK